jgi:hypothetical protein
MNMRRLSFLPDGDAYTGVAWRRCSRQQASQATQLTNAGVVFPATDAVHEDSLLPRVGELAGYIGSSACKDCHEKQYASWHRSYHRTMTQLPVPGAVQANFNNVVLTNAGVRYILARKGDEFWIHLESQLPGMPDRPAPEPEDISLGLVTGSHHMQVFWMALAGQLPELVSVHWLIPEQRWVPELTFITPIAGAPAETWIVCARCHATATQPTTIRSEDVAYASGGTGHCLPEACHGPEVSATRSATPTAAP